MLQGFAAFKLNLQLSQEYDAKLAKAAGRFRNQLTGSAFEQWKQHAQYSKELKNKLATAVGALRNRSLRSAFCGWREAAAIKREHSQKVDSGYLLYIHALTRSISILGRLEVPARWFNATGHALLPDQCCSLPHVLYMSVCSIVCSRTPVSLC